jgi:hypothetical protein
VDEVESVARDAAQLHGELKRYLRVYACAHWSSMIRAGAEFTAPEAWSILSPSKMAASLVRAERERVENTPLYALDLGASSAAIRAGAAGIVLTPDVLPAPSGSIYFHLPVAEPGPHRTGPARIVTWGAPAPSMGLPGMWLTWYADMRDGMHRAVAAAQPDARVILDQENFLRFLPAIQSQLMPGEPPADETSRILRTVMLALFAIKQGLMETKEVHVADAASNTPVQVAHVTDQDAEGLPLAIAETAGLHSQHAIQSL